ncbi:MULTISPECIES: alpha/beta hydrolase [Sphingobacterium]|uniref:alpha/beta hydrolase n=1 Tax=Sphingobacterium TaxID=28453 RepID=UPI00257BA49B|nr:MULTISPECIES: alpha/beta hydrolase [Sphingobacterium]
MTAFTLRYPIILIHGTAAGDNSLFWGRIPKTFKKNNISFFYGKTDGWGSVANNAQMLKRNLSDLAEKTGATKFNLIAHSKGGIDARYLISTLKGHQMVASLSTISTPHLGTPIADYLMEKHLSRDSVTKKLIQRLSFLFGGQSPAPIELIRDLSVKEMRVFNQLNPNMDNVFYQSFASTMTKPQDDLFYALSFKYLRRLVGENDGMVPLESAVWGANFKHIHASQGISHAGITDVIRKNIGDVDIPQIYLDIIRRLGALGL